MASTREVRRRIRSVKNTAQITKAMQMVASSKMRRAQERVHQARPYSEQIRALVSRKGRLWPVIAIGTITVLIASSSISPYVSLYQWGFHPILAFSDGQAIGMSFQTKCTQTIVADSYSATYLHFTYNRSTADLYGYSIGLPLNSTGVCILAQTESNIVYTKTIQGATSLGVDSADFSPGITELPVGFQSRLASTWGLQKVYDDGDTGWYLEN